MNGLNLRWLAIAISVYIAAVLDASVSERIAVFGAAPSFLFILIGQFCIPMNRTKGMLFGFMIGAIQGALAGSDIQHFMAGGVIGGLLAASCRDLSLDYSLLAVVSVTAITSFLARLIHVLLAPPPHVSVALLDTLIGAMYNGVLAAPVFFIFKKMMEPSDRLSRL